MSVENSIKSSLVTIIRIDKGLDRGYNRTLFVNSVVSKLKTKFKNGLTDEVNETLDYIIELEKNLDKKLFTSRSPIWKLRTEGETK